MTWLQRIAALLRAIADALEQRHEVKMDAPTKVRAEVRPKPTDTSTD